MSKKISILFILLVIVSLMLAACQPQAPAAEEPAAEEPMEEEAMEEEPMEEAGVKICQVTDAGGIDDKSFNATAWKGIENAMADLDVDGKYLESQQQTDYEKNINAFLEEDCDMIVTVGFLLGDATQAAAEANPDQPFAIVDYAYDPVIPNVLALVYATDEAAFLAGYLSAGMTETGVIGTFGGIQIPTVTVFMDGFALGADYYNEQHGTDVQVLGWDPATQTGSFVGNFESADDGRLQGEALMDEGADIIMPVAGPVGLGTAAAVLQRGNAYIIGVDDDWVLTAPDYADVTLTSVMKKMDQSVFDATQLILDDEFEGGSLVGTLDNGGVDLAPFHDMDSAVPDDLKAEMEEVKAAIIAGDIATSP